MENTIQFIQVTPQELEDRIIEGVKKLFAASIPPAEDDKLLSRNDAAKFLGITMPTLWDWTRKGFIKSYGIGNRVYYKKSELIASLEPLKV